MMKTIVAASDERVREAVRRSAFLRNICADLSRRADPDLRTDEEMEVLGKVMSMLEALETLGVEDLAYLEHRANILEQITLVAGNAINVNVNIEVGNELEDVEQDLAEQTLSASFDKPDVVPVTWADGQTSQNVSMTVRFGRGAAFRGHSNGGGRLVDKTVNPDVIGKADGLLRRAFLMAWNRLFEAPSADLAEPLLNAVANCVVSLFWAGRGNKKMGGRHASALDEDDTARRAEIKQALMMRLHDTELPLHRSIVVRVLAALSYAMNSLSREDVLAAVDIAFSPAALDQFEDWRTFNPTLVAFHNIVLSLLNTTQGDEDEMPLAIALQHRVMKKGGELLAQLVDNPQVPDDVVRKAGSALLSAATVLAYKMGQPAYDPALQSSWHMVAVAIGPIVERLKIDSNLLTFLALPFAYEFENQTSDVIGMRFADVPRRLRPLFEARRISDHDFRHHYRQSLEYLISRYVLDSPASEQDTLDFAASMHLCVGDVFLAEVHDTLGKTGCFALTSARALTLAEWLGATGNATAIFEGTNAGRTIYALWSRLLFDGAAQKVHAAIEELWDRSEGHGLEQVLGRTLALRGFALAVSYGGAAADADARFEARLQQVRMHGTIDWLREVEQPPQWQNAWKDHDDAVVEATMALASIDIQSGGDIDRWPAVENWSVNFASVVELDRRLATALLERIRLEKDAERGLADLQVVRRLAQRQRSLLRAAIQAVLVILPEGSGEREALLAERESIPDENDAKIEPRDVPYDLKSGMLSPQEEGRIRDRAATAAAWHLPVPFAAVWEDLGPEDLLVIVQRARSTMTDYRAATRAKLADAVRARRTTLPFYKGHDLVEIMVDDGGVPRSFNMIFGPEAAVWLHGKSDPLHRLNSTVPIDLAGGIFAELYLRFFCYYVQGDQGPFHIVANRDELQGHLLSGTTMSEEHGALVEGKFTELREKGQRRVSSGPTDAVIAADEKGRFLESVVVVYGKCLFTSDFVVEPTGMVKMTDDEPLFGDANLRIERIVVGWRAGRTTLSPEAIS